MSYFQEARNVELSVIYYLETQIGANWSGIAVVKNFNNAYKEPLPVVAISLGPVDPTPKEVGSTDTIETYTMNINIFAKSGGQRIDLSNFILTQLKTGCVYYEHSQTSGSPETLTRTANGRIRVYRYIASYPLDFGEDGVDKYDEFRWIISVQMRKS